MSGFYSYVKSQKCPKTTFQINAILPKLPVCKKQP